MREHQLPMKRVGWGALIAVVMCMPLTTTAQRKGNAAADVAQLYAMPPAGFIHVRVVNPSSTPVLVQIGGQRAERLSTVTKMASDYFAQRGGADFLVKVDGKPLMMDQAAPRDGFVTLVLKDVTMPSAQAIIDRAAEGSELKAQLTLYNLIKDCTAQLRLTTGAVVLQSVPAFSSDVRAVNPVVAQLTGGCGVATSVPLQLPPLKAGDRYSLFLFGYSDAPVLAGQTARTEPYRSR